MLPRKSHGKEEENVMVVFQRWWELIGVSHIQVQALRIAIIPEGVTTNVHTCLENELKGGPGLRCCLFYNRTSIWDLSGKQ